MSADKLSKYVDDLLNEEEKAEVAEHIKHCSPCKEVVQLYKEEEKFMKETLLTPSLPDDFANKVIAQLEEKKGKKRKSFPKRFATAAAGIIVAIGLSATISPTFAEWIGSIFQTERVDEGLRMATEAGLVIEVNEEVTDQGYTLRVEDVVADSSRIAIAYQVLKNGKIIDPYVDNLHASIQVLGANGNNLDVGIGWSWQSVNEYGIVEIRHSELDEEIDDEIVVSFDLKELKGVAGNWKLDIPIHLQETKKYTESLDLENKKLTSHGVEITMKEIEFAPSSVEFNYETTFTDEEKRAVEEKMKKVKEKFNGELDESSIPRLNSEIEYHLENEQKEVLYQRHSFIGETTSNVRMLQGLGRDGDKLGHTIWKESFIPLKEKENMTFVLDRIIKRELADFSISFKTDDVNKRPLTFEYEGNVLTIKEAKLKRENGMFGEKAFTIEMEGGKEKDSSYIETWVLVDENGNVYESFGSSSILDEVDEYGRNKMSYTLRFSIDHVPDEVTLHLLTVMRAYDVEERLEFPLY